MPRRPLAFVAAISLFGLTGLGGCGSSFFSGGNAPGCSSFFHSPSCDSGGSTTSGNYAFVANSGANTVSAFSISTAGALSVLSGSPLSISNSQPTAVAVSRNNGFLYVGNASQILGYAISSSGVLTALSSGAALANVGVTDMQVSPDGAWLMVLDSSGFTVDLFSINSSTGALTQGTSAPIQLSTNGTVPYHLSISPAGTAVAATMGVGGQILWSFNTSTGVFTQLSQTSTPNSLTAARGLAWDATGKYLFVTYTGTGQGLSVQSVASNGLLTPTTSTVYSTGNTPTSVAIDNTGKYAYVTNQADSNITGYAIGASEALTAISGSPFSSGSGATSIGMDSTGKWVLVAAQGGSPDLTLYGFDSTTGGKLNVISSTATGTNANFVALSH